MLFCLKLRVATTPVSRFLSSKLKCGCIESFGYRFVYSKTSTTRVHLDGAKSFTKSIQSLQSVQRFHTALNTTKHGNPSLSVDLGKQIMPSNIKKALRILFFTNAHNSMSQAAYLMLTQMGHQVMIEIAISSEKMQQVANELKPDLILCPFLTKAVPESLFTRFKTLIVHPGIVGDRGMHSLDWALLEKQKEWGVTVLEAVKEMDAGPIYATENFRLDDLPSFELVKSKVYRNQVVPAALKAIRVAIANFIQLVPPIPLDYSNPAVKGTLKPMMKQAQCTVDWDNDDALTIVHKISSRDTYPGVLDNALLNERIYLYGAHIETLIKVPSDTPSKQLLGQRDGAILISCKAGKEAVWITHMKRATKNSFKLPSVFLLNHSRLAILPVLPIDFTTKPAMMTYNEIYYELKGNVVYLHFEFYNGAMSTVQCQRLLQALDQIDKIKDVKVVVLCGGSSYFSNGIHLNIIEAAENQGKESWYNINAINDVVLKIMSMTNKLTIAAIQGSAGAGGVMMALAADLVFANYQSILNPHYRNMSLFGSEYWTYNLPRRIGHLRAIDITEACQPLSAQKAKDIGLIDDIFYERGDRMLDEMARIIDSLLLSKQYKHLLLKKHEERDPIFYNQLKECRSYELAKMSENFRDPAYHNARYSFVHKLQPFITPWNISKLGRNKAIRINGEEIANFFKRSISQEIISLQNQIKEAGLIPRSPGLACLLVGNRSDSMLYVQKKAIHAENLGFFTQIAEINNKDGTNLRDLQDKVIDQIEQWNTNPFIDGIIVQLPLPRKLNERLVLDTINVGKDVDGLHSCQLADISSSITAPSLTSFLPCTVLGILEALQLYDVKLSGKNVCVVGASKTVGLPLSLALSSRGSTVTICTVHTDDLKAKVKLADIVIASAGVPNLVKADWIKPGCVVIDAGITVMNRTSSGKLKICGDVEQNELLWHRASLVTPVPGGVGPITVTMLLRNTLRAYKFHVTQELMSIKKTNNA